MSTPSIVRRGIAWPAARMPAPAKPNKYHAIRCVGLNGEIYQSRAERAYAFTLEQRRIAGLISRWSWAPRFVLQDEPRIAYRPDFVFWTTADRMIVVDVKGVLTAGFSLRKRLWQAAYPDVPLLIVKNGVEVSA